IVWVTIIHFSFKTKIIRILNPMSTPAPNTSNHTNSTVYPSEGMRVLQMTVTVMIFIVGVSLNALVVWALGVRVWCRNKGVTGKTQSADSFRIYVVNLALADLVLLLRTPLMLSYLANHFTWTLGEPVCKLVIYLRCLGLYASAFLLCAVAVERCLCLLRPVWARLRRPRWVVPVACAAIWVLAAVFAAPYIETAKVILWANRKACIESDLGVGQALNSTMSSPTSPSGPAIGAAYVALFMVYIKSALNPVLYVFAARGLGRTVRASLVSTIERVFNEELSESLRRKSLRRRDSEF
uniref:C3a anaphylatoxin chemotactic receptor-like n=1 Tax=Sinocyclocheilus grahami TaxID=75366 RepID=A0A672SJK1_SINGR